MGRDVGPMATNSKRNDSARFSAVNRKEKESEQGGRDDNDTERILNKTAIRFDAIRDRVTDKAEEVLGSKTSADPNWAGDFQTPGLRNKTKSTR